MNQKEEERIIEQVTRIGYLTKILQIELIADYRADQGYGITNMENTVSETLAELKMILKEIENNE